MNQLLPIIRRVRRPLLPVESVPDRAALPVVVVNDVPGETPETTRETRVLPETNDASDESNKSAE